MQQEWEGKRIARQFAGYIIKLWRSQGSQKSSVQDALQLAICHYYESKEKFYDGFLQHLTPEQLQEFYKLLHDYLEDFHNTIGGIDPEELAAIRDRLRESVLGGIEPADATKTVSPSTRAGSRWSGSGKGGGRS